MSPVPASLAHFVIFSPSVRAPTRSDAPTASAAAGAGTDQQRIDVGGDISDVHTQEGETESRSLAEDAALGLDKTRADHAGAEGKGEGERDKDLEDDLREAAQILFYTSREANVSRDRMLRQVGLAKGLMGFADLVTRNSENTYYSIRSQRARLLVFAPEPGIYIYINVALAHDPAKPGEAIPGAQGLSDALLVDALKRGYEGFCLLHSPLSRLLPPTPTFSSTIDNFFTRFSHQLDDQIASPSLVRWLGGLAPCPALTPAAEAALIALAGPGAAVGVLRPVGPVAVPPKTGPLTRYLMSVVEASVPAPAPGRPNRVEKKEERKASWALNWIGSPSRSGTPVEGSPSRAPEGLTKDVAGKEAEKKGRKWLGMGTIGIGGLAGLGGLGGIGSGIGTGIGDAVNGMGAAVSGVGAAVTGMSAALKLGKGKDEPAGEIAEPGVTTSEPGSGEAETAVDVASAPNDASVEGAPDAESTASQQTIASDAEVPENQERVAAEPTVVRALDDAISTAVAEPTDAVVDAAVDVAQLELAETEGVEMTWDGRDVWIESEDAWERRRVVWVIRDATLLFILHPPATDTAPVPPAPPAERALAVFSAFSPVGQPAAPLANASVLLEAGDVSVLGPAVDTASERAMLEMRGMLLADPSLAEMHVRTPAQRFVAARRSGVDELYMLVGRKDASLTDSEHAVRALARGHPQFA
ncbi:hypothetical protein Q5752_003774 [Cryptotrichosporon argae]